MDKGAFGAFMGEAHEYLAAGILMRMGFLVSVHTSRGGAFDIIILGFRNYSQDRGGNTFLRAQVKTMNGPLTFVAGVRAGADRTYRSGVKAYKYTEKHHDLIIGVDKETLDLYFVPTRFISAWGKSISKSKLGPLKNNVDVLLNWNDDFLSRLGGELSR